MPLIRCRVCGQMVSDQARQCPRCGNPNLIDNMQYQMGYNQYPQNNDNQPNKWLYAIIGVLSALVVFGAIAFFTMSKDDEDDLETAQTENKDAVSDNSADAPQKEVVVVQEVKKDVPAQQPVAPQPAKQTYVPPRNIVLSGILNGDYVTFDLNSSGSSSVRGQFYNSSINVSFAVKGTLTGSSLNLRSVNHGKWRFNATNYGGTYRGYASNGSVTYNMEVQ